MSSPRLILFGKPRLEIGDKIIHLGNQRPVQLLCYLACCGGEASNSDIIRDLWPSHSRADEDNLKSLRSVARKLLDHEDPHHYFPRGDFGRTSLVNLECDAITFRSLVERTRIGEAGNRTEALQRARDFYQEHIERRELLEGCSWPWKPKMRRRFDELIESITVSPLGQPDANSKALWTVPYRENPFFTGRTEDLECIRQMLNTEKRSTLAQAVCIVGEGGKGKTELALRYCYAFRGEYEHVVWLNADSRGSLQADLVRAHNLLFGFDDGLDQSPASDLLRAAKMRDRLRDLPKCLVVLDNADDPDGMVRAEEEAGPEVRLLKPILALQGAHVLVTSRKEYWGDLANPIRLDTLSIEEGALLFLKRASGNSEATLLGDFAEPDQSAAMAFCDHVDGFALALDQAGVTCREYGWSPTRYLDEFLQRFGELMGTRNLTDRHEKAVLATVQTSLKEIDAACPQAGALIRWCAYLPPDAIPHELFEVLEGEVADSLKGVPLPRAAQVARDQSLLHADSDQKTYSMHRLVQRVIRLMDSGCEEGNPEHYNQLAEAALMADPGPDSQFWPIAERLAPAWRHIGHHGPDSETIVRTLNRLTRHSLVAYATPSTLQDARLALDRSVKCLGPAHPATLETQLNLGLTLENLGHWEEALTLATDLHRMRAELLGPDHLDTIAAKRVVGGSYLSLHRMEEACLTYEDILASAIRTHGEQDQHTLQCISHVAIAYEMAGRDEEALALFKHVLEAHCSTLGDSHPETLATMNLVANSHYRLTQYDTAAALHKQILQRRQELLGEGHPDTLITTNNLVSSLIGQGDLEAALSLCLRLIDLRKKVLGDGHPETYLSQHKLALIYWELGRKQDAIDLETEVLSGVESCLSPTHLYPIRVRTTLESWLQSESERNSVKPG